jgi:hypothetical protein
MEMAPDKWPGCPSFRERTASYGMTVQRSRSSSGASAATWRQLCVKLRKSQLANP